MLIGEHQDPERAVVVLLQRDGVRILRHNANGLVLTGLDLVDRVVQSVRELAVHDDSRDGRDDNERRQTAKDDFLLL